MSKITYQEKLAEIEAIGKRCIFILNYFTEKSGDANYFNKFIELVASEVKRKSLLRMRMLKKDIDEWARGLKPSDLMELEERMQSELGMSLAKDREKEIIIINNIIKRGRIKNIKEYALLRERVEEIYDDETKSAEVEVINEMLNMYDN